MQKLLASAAMAAALTVATTAAKADLILTFGESAGGGAEISATVAAGVTTLSAVNGPVTITQIFGDVPTINPALFNLHATSIGPATDVGGDVHQAFSGTFSIAAGGADYLSGTFTDALFGSGTGLTFSASNATPGETVSFTSNVIPLSELGPPEALSLSFADVSPPAGTDPAGCSGTPGCTIAPFTSSVSGTASSTPVPEPASLAIIGMALIGFGAAYRQRKSL